METTITIIRALAVARGEIGNIPDLARLLIEQGREEPDLEYRALLGNIADALFAYSRDKFNRLSRETKAS